MSPICFFERRILSNMDKIYGFHTHYEIMDYQLGDFKQLEVALSLWDSDTFQLYAKYYYDETQYILYVPRGFDPVILSNWSGQPIHFVKQCNESTKISFQMTTCPRTQSQEKAIRFLSGIDEFQDSKLDAQKVLIMPPGEGKTYCMIHAISLLRLRTMIIVPTNNLKDQWVQRIKDYTNLTDVNIETGSITKMARSLSNRALNKKIFFVVTLAALDYYMTEYGPTSLNDVLIRLGIGIKVFDEAHKEYRRILMTDYFTNVKHTFYLTATFAKSDPGDNAIYQRCFNLVRKLKLKKDNIENHIIYIPILYNTNPNPIMIQRIFNKKRRFNRFLYIDYQLAVGVLENLMEEFIRHFLVTHKMEGKTLILSSKKTTCEYFADMMKRIMSEDYQVCAHYTGHKVDGFKNDYGTICATPQMLGTGEDIDGLRFMFNTEPGRSLPNTDQFSGRLRPYDGGKKPTYYIEFIDKGFPKVYEWYLYRKKLLQTKVRKIQEYDKS